MTQLTDDEIRSVPTFNLSRSFGGRQIWVNSDTARAIEMAVNLFPFLADEVLARRAQETVCG